MSHKLLGSNFYSHPLIVGLGYLCILWLCVLPWSFDPYMDSIGFWGSDMLDTISLHWLTIHPTGHFAPEGYDFWSLTPNVLDHLTFAPLQETLPFPLNVNIWWIGILWLNAVSAHWMAYQYSQKMDTAWLIGTLCLTAEPIIREVNWGHAPQSMWFPALISLGYWFKWERSNQVRYLWYSGGFCGLAGWAYLFYAPFLGLILFPKLLSSGIRHTLRWSGVASFVLMPNIVWLWTIAKPMINIPLQMEVHGSSQMQHHSNDILWWWNTAPLDTSNMLSIVFILSGIWNLYAWKRNQTNSIIGLWGLVIGGLLIMGLNTPAFEWLQSIPIANRLQWPERYGIVALTGGLILVLSLPKPMWFIPFALLETSIRSGNVPLHSVSIKPYICYRELQNGAGNVLSLPIKDGHNLYNLNGLFQQLHHRDLVNPFILPPFTSPPKTWEQRRLEDWMLQLDGEEPMEHGHTETLQAMNIGSIIIDKTWVPIESQLAIINRLSKVYGEPQDLGCIFHWSINGHTLQNRAYQQGVLSPVSVESLQVPLQ